MRIVEYSAKNPEENIALDELLLMKAESGEIGETLRFWTSGEHFVVLGRACRAQDDCFLDRCGVDGVKVIRRASGGGTVLQGPGCLNYSLVLSYDRNERYRDIRYSYCNILGAVSEALRKNEYDVEFFPISDLTLDERKISGNAQIRKKKFFLHHGTILHDFDLWKISYYLRHPGREPEYRRERKHEDFVRNIPMPPEDLKNLIGNVFFDPDEIWKPSKEDLGDLRGLVSRKYSSEQWNLAF